MTQERKTPRSYMQESRNTILIVDDDEEIVTVLKTHFKNRNCETIVTVDPSTVVDKLKNFAVTLMLLDLKMKKLDGFQVLDKVKQANLNLPPTIIITGFLAKYQDKLQAYGLDLSDVVTKPFEFVDLENCINRKLGSQIVGSEVGTEYENKIYEKNRCHLGFVEDEEDVAKDLSDFFKERNYKVSLFTNGTVALEALQKNPVDILFVDIKLQGIQGDQLIAELCKTPNHSYIIPISADPLPEEMGEKLKELGCEKFIGKPFEIVELIELVKTIAIKKKLLG